MAPDDADVPCAAARDDLVATRVPSRAGGFDRALAGFEGTEETFDANGSQALVSYNRVKASNWIVAAVYPKDEAFLAVHDLIWHFIEFLLVAFVISPQSFAGLFGAAPSVALATLALSVAFDGRDNAAQQSTSMMASSIALFCYSSCVSWIMMHRPHRTIWVTILVLPVWLAVSFGLWWALLR